VNTEQRRAQPPPRSPLLPDIAQRVSIPRWREADAPTASICDLDHA